MRVEKITEKATCGPVGFEGRRHRGLEHGAVAELEREGERVHLVSV